MSVPIKYDTRYKVNAKIVCKMKQLRDKGWTYQKIADKFGVNNFTSYYWINDDYRKQKREQNRNWDESKRKNKKERIKQSSQNRLRLWKQFKPMYICDAITNAKNEKRPGKHRFTAFGKPLKEIEKEYKKYKKGGRKIDNGR
jgi:hypothetical protein